MASLIEKLKQARQAPIQQTAALEERRKSEEQRRINAQQLREDEIGARKKQHLEYWQQETQIMLDQSGLPGLFAKSNLEQKLTLEPVYEVGSLIGFKAHFNLRARGEKETYKARVGISLDGDIMFGSNTLSVQKCQKKPELVEKYIIDNMLNDPRLPYPYDPFPIHHEYDPHGGAPGMY